MPFGLGIAGLERGADNMSFAVKEGEAKGRRVSRRRRRIIAGIAGRVITTMD